MSSSKFYAKTDFSYKTLHIYLGRMAPISSKNFNSHLAPSDKKSQLHEQNLGAIAQLLDLPVEVFQQATGQS
jgi:hypothetical protein